MYNEHVIIPNGSGFTSSIDQVSAYMYAHDLAYDLLNSELISYGTLLLGHFVSLEAFLVFRPGFTAF